MVWTMVVKQSFNCHLDDDNYDDADDDEEDGDEEEGGHHCENYCHLPFPQ